MRAPLAAGKPIPMPMGQSSHAGFRLLIKMRGGKRPTTPPLATRRHANAVALAGQLALIFARGTEEAALSRYFLAA